MNDHAECDRLYHEALAAGRDGYAEYLAARCDLAHGDLTVSRCVRSHTDLGNTNDH